MKLGNASFVAGIFFAVGVGSLLQEITAEGLKGASEKTTTTRSRKLQDIDLGEIIGISCFSETSTVRVRGVSEPVLMKDLQVGDHVLTTTTTNDQYAPIYAFAHRHANKLASFVQIQTEKGMLEMTSEHLVFPSGEGNPVRADSIREGDTLRGGDGDHESGVKVLAIDNILRRGVYAPLTTTGTIVVDGVVASSYVALQANDNQYVQLNSPVVGGHWNLISHHTYMHLGLSPLRQACLGLSPRLCSHDNEEGMPSYVAFAKQFDHDVHCQSIVVQALVLPGTILLLAVMSAVESAFGPAHAPAILLTLGGMYFLMRALNIRVRAKVKFSRQ